MNTGTGTLSRKTSNNELQEKNDMQTQKFGLKDLQAHTTFKIEACQSVQTQNRQMTAIYSDIDKLQTF